MAQLLICNGVVWTFNPDGNTQWTNPDALGFLPGFLNAEDARPACEQLDANYGYGGHWRAGKIDAEGTYRYPGDPPLRWAARATLRDETILFYPYAFVAVIQPDGSNVMQRMD